MGVKFIWKKGYEIFSEIRGVKFLWEKIRGLKIYSEKIRGLKNLGFSRENTPAGYSPLKMNAPLPNLNKNHAFVCDWKPFSTKSPLFTISEMYGSLRRIKATGKT